MTDSDGTVAVRVEGARKRDAGRGRARLSDTVQSELGVLSGDPIIIEGDRLTVAKVWPSDEGGRFVRIDADTRASANVNMATPYRFEREQSRTQRKSLSSPLTSTQTTPPPNRRSDRNSSTTSSAEGNVSASRDTVPTSSQRRYRLGRSESPGQHASSSDPKSSPSKKAPNRRPTRRKTTRSRPRTPERPTRTSGVSTRNSTSSAR